MKLQNIKINGTLIFMALMIGFLGGYGYTKEKDNQTIKEDYKAYRDSVDVSNELRTINFVDSLIK